MMKKYLNTYIENIIFMLIYIATAKIGQVFAIDPGNVTPIWIPSGIIFFVIYLYGYRLLPGIFFGAAIGNSWAYFSTESLDVMLLDTLAASMNGIGDMLAAVVGVYFVKKITEIDDFFTNTKSINYFIIFAVIAGPLISAIFGVTGLWLSNHIASNDYYNVFITWLIGDSVGVLLTAPLFISLYKEKLKCFSNKDDLKVFFVLILLAVAIILSPVFDTYNSLKYFLIIFPIIIILSFRKSISLPFLATFLTTVFMVTSYTLKVDAHIQDELIGIQLSAFLMFTTALYLVSLINTHEILNTKHTSLKKEELSLLTTLDMHVIFSKTDLNGAITQVSQAFCDISGYSKEELLGQSHNIVRHPDTPKELFQEVWENLKNKTPINVELKNRKKDGSAYWVYTSFDMEYNDNDVVIGYIAIRHDITAEKKFETLSKNLESQVIQRTQELNNANAKLEKLSLLDSLTSISNRRMFDQTLEKEWLEAQRNKSSISLIMIDIDFFKAYNDSYGHLKGDSCLQEVTKSLKIISKRPKDLLARYGGEEFVILLPSTEKEGAIEIAEQCRRTVEEQRIPHNDSSISKVVTISVGVYTIIPSAEIQAISLIQGADDLLYAAKENGRNQVKSM